MAAISLTIFFPCYNDARTIGALIAQADAVAAELSPDYEIIVVDDGSCDGSRTLLKALAAGHPRLRLVFHDCNLGYGAALLSGFRHATKEWVFYTDGDGQYDVRELRALLSLAGNGVDLVNGRRLSRSDPLYRVAIGRLYQWALRWLFCFRVCDLSCDFRLVRKRVVDALALSRRSGAICVEFVAKFEKAGFASVDCLVHHFSRPHGASQFFTTRHLWATVVDLLQLWRELNRRAHGTG